MTARTPPTQDAVLIEAMNNATSLELYQLAALIEPLMTDPRRIVAIRKDMHLGQVVRFCDARRDKMLVGQVVDMRDTSLTVHGTEVHGEWRLPYAAIEPPQPGVKPEPAPAPSATRRGRHGPLRTVGDSQSCGHSGASNTKPMGTPVMAPSP